MPSDTSADDSKAGPGTAAVLEAIPQPVWVCDEAGVIQSQNQKAGVLTENIGDAHCRSIGELIEHLNASETRSRLQKVFDDLSNSKSETSCEFRLDSDCALPASMSSDDRWNSQRPVALELKARQTRQLDLAETAIVFTGHWIWNSAGRHEDDPERAARTSRFELASRGAHAGLWAWRLESDTFYYSERFTEILGYGRHDSEDSREAWFDRVHEEDRPKLDASITQYLRSTEPDDPAEPFEVELRVRHADSGYRWVLFRGIGTADRDGRVQRMAGSVTDITDRKRAEERQQYDAFHDKLTDLPNRALFLDRLAQLLEVQREYPTRRFGLLYMDLDRFKKVNDSLGPSAGDELLCQVTTRIRSVVRESDTLARVGGDEFGLLLVNVDGESVAKRIAADIQETLDRPFEVAGREIYISASIGMLVSDPEYNHAEEMLRDVDIAMYHAKSNDADIAMFDSEMHASVLGESHLESSLRHAVDSEQIVSHYQPIVDLEEGRIVGLEALMRWNHPEAGWVPPGEFFPIAKETGLLVPMGQSLLKEVCYQMQSWRQAGVMGDDVQLSVNFSAAELTERGFVSNVERVLNQTGLPGRVLQAEITEHTLVNQPDEAGRVLESLKALGVGVAIDDFGTGYSSLNYLRQFDSDAIKIDRDFIEHLPDREDDRQIVTTILRLAESLDKRVVCEGIETASQNNMLLELGVQLGQGFYWGRPAPAEDLEQALKERKHLTPEPELIDQP
jgi:diguanylate cyclase (GGDEF)-like protein/PAS domain S-box-containing protein